MLKNIFSLTLSVVSITTVQFSLKVVAQTSSQSCAAQGCAQIFGVTGNDDSKLGAVTRYSANTATSTSPNLKISSGWIATPIGLTNLSRGGFTTYIETRSTKDCRYGCDRIYACHTARYGSSNVTDVVDSSTFWTDSTLLRTYGVRYVGNNNWQAFWCDSQQCRNFAPVNLSQGQGFPFAASGGESSSPNNYFGNVQFNNNRLVYAGATQYTSFCWSFPVKNNLVQGSSNGISSCASFSWTTTYKTNTAFMRFNERAYQNIYLSNIDRISTRRPLLASREINHISEANNRFLNAQSTSNENRSFNSKPLLSASDQEIIDAALEWTRISFDVSGTPKVVLVRSVTVDDLSKLGLPEAAGVNSGKSLKLVVLKGDFDLTNLRGGFSSK